MAKRSIHVSKQAEDIIGFLSDEVMSGCKNYSGSINSALVMLEQLMIQGKPDLSMEEWVYLANTYSGCLIEFSMPIRIPSDIMDDLGIYDVAQIDEVGRGLIEKISRMSQCQQAAILWEVKRIWQSV